jgi:hypothetical protein
MTGRPPAHVRERLAEELATRLDTLLPESLRLFAGPGARLALEGEDGTWGGTDMDAVDAYDTVDSLAEYAMWSLQDDVAHAITGGWPPVGAPRLNLPWVKREGDLLRLGFDGGIELEPIALTDLGLE